MTIHGHEYCGKIPYGSRYEAKIGMRLINRDLLKEGKPPLQRTYFCDVCEAWHTTTMAVYDPPLTVSNNRLL